MKISVKTKGFMTELKKNVAAFVVGSSIICTIITFLYTGNAYKRSGRRPDVPYENIPVVVAILFGFFNVLNVHLTKKYGNNVSFLVGGLMGLTFSSIGRFGMDLPTKIFGFNRKNEYLVHLYAFVLYGLIFRFIVQPLNMYLQI